MGLRFKKCLFKAFIRRRSKNLQEKNTKKGRERLGERGQQRERIFGQMTSAKDATSRPRLDRPHHDANFGPEQAWPSLERHQVVLRHEIK